MTVRLRDMSVPIHDSISFRAPFYIGLQARLKIGTHLLSNRSPDGIRTLTVQPFSLPFSYNPGHKYLRLVHILNEFFFHHKQSKGISNDIKSS